MKKPLMQNSFLLLGSNLGNKEEQLTQAISLISRSSGNIVTKSPLFFSEAWGYNDATYLNQAIEISTSLSPYELLHSLQKIEKQLGRTTKTTTHYQARTIDIDIILFADNIISSEDLTIPHPRMHLRNFVLQPLLSIAPNAIHPIFKKTIDELANETPDKGKVWRKD